MKKLYNEKGQVAVAVSYGFGAGWSTWTEVNPMDARYNKLILNKQWEEAEALADKEGHYYGGLRDCKIVWLDEGTNFQLEEYDGNESLTTEDDLYYQA